MGPSTQVPTVAKQTLDNFQGSAVDKAAVAQRTVRPDGSWDLTAEQAELDRINNVNIRRTGTVNLLTDQAGRDATILTGSNQPGQQAGLKKTNGFNPTSIL